MNRNILKVLIVLALVLGMAAPVMAITYTEVGDAGDSLATTQGIPGTSVPLTLISGSLTSNSDVDLYKIYINDPVNFTASTVGLTLGSGGGRVGNQMDTMLFLFKANGNAVIGDDDFAPGSVQESTLSKGTIYQPTTAGFYYLGISQFDRSPNSTSGPMFSGESVLATDTNYIMPPTATGSTETLSGWTGGYSDYGPGTYSISLTGVTAVPIPPSALLLGSGLLGLVGLGWRRRKVS